MRSLRWHSAGRRARWLEEATPILHAPAEALVRIPFADAMLVAVPPAVDVAALASASDNLVSTVGSRWEWSGGRPERGESWEDTLRREILEEACATITGARLLGFARARCLSGHENELVLVRSIWRAEVRLLASTSWPVAPRAEKWSIL